MEDLDRRKESRRVASLATIYLQHPASSDTAMVETGCQEENQSPFQSTRIKPYGSRVSRASVDEDRIAGTWYVLASVRVNDLHVSALKTLNRAPRCFACR